MISAGALSVIAFAWAWRLGIGREFSLDWQPARMSRLLFIGAAAVYMIVCGGLAILAAISPVDYGEAAYFLRRLDLVVGYGKAPLRDFEFAYGPSLLYLPSGLSWATHIKPESAYYVCLIGMSLAGLWLVFQMVERLLPADAPRAAIFVGVAALGINLSLGMNYTFFRFGLPFAATFAWNRIQTRGRAALSLAALSLLIFSISTEVGIAFAAATAASCIYRACTEDRRWLRSWGWPRYRPYSGGISSVRSRCFQEDASTSW